MKTMLRFLRWGLLSIGVFGLTISAKAGNIFYQAQCVGTACVSFNSTQTIPTIRTFTFNPGTGTRKALVQFAGTLHCYDTSTVIKDKLIELVSQIVIGTEVPTIDKPSSELHAVVLKDSADHTLASENTFNLATARVLGTTGASKTVSFKIRRNRMDAGIFCDTYNAAFSVVILP